MVAGKGGLRREVMLSHALAEELKGRSRILLLLANHKNALFTLVFGKIDFPEHRRTF